MRDRVRKWTDVLRGMADGTLAIGRRDPIEETPVWVTPEVARGGFATGKFAAAGPLDEFERKRLQQLGRDGFDQPRLHLNRSFLTRDGIRELAAMLDTGCFRVTVPEHAALLVAVVLIVNGEADDAEGLLELIRPWMDRLRFYPEPTQRPVRPSREVFLESVGQVSDRLDRIQEHRRIATQNETLRVWVPLHDQFVRLFVESCEHPAADDADGLGRPLVACDDRWRRRLTELLLRYEDLRRVHCRSGKPDRRGEVFCELRRAGRAMLDVPVGGEAPEALRRRVAELLRQDYSKRGALSSEDRRRLRSAQAHDARIPTHAAAARVVRARLAEHDPDGGLAEPSRVLVPDLNDVERARLFPDPSRADMGTFEFPDSVRRRVERCRQAPIESLVAGGAVASGDVLATLVPQITGIDLASSVSDEPTRNLYYQTYRAFRNRRSLLLLNYAGQLRFGELPWVAALSGWRVSDGVSVTAARRTLVNVATLNLRQFPHAIVPNKLLQELRTLAELADVRIDLLDELAADIFMGEFTQKFGRTAKLAARRLAGTIYARYYDIDTDAITRMDFGRGKLAAGLGDLCRRRAGVKSAGWSAATNGCVIEQQQILTTQNLAALEAVPEIGRALKPYRLEMARRTFDRLVTQLRVSRPDRHSRLVAVKNAAYGWRQMLFYLSDLERSTVAEFEQACRSSLIDSDGQFAESFLPAMVGLRNANERRSVETSGGRRLLGWTTDRHWLLPR